MSGLGGFQYVTEAPDGVNEGNIEVPVDLLAQMRAVIAALRQVELGVLKTHIDHCIRSAAETHDPVAVNRKVDELISVLDRYGR